MCTKGEVLQCHIVMSRPLSNTLKEKPSQINVILQQKVPVVLYINTDWHIWLQLWLQNHCKNTGFYSVFQLSFLLLLNYYQYNCNNTISSVSVCTSLMFAGHMFIHLISYIHIQYNQKYKQLHQQLCCDIVRESHWMIVNGFSLRMTKKKHWDL